MSNGAGRIVIVDEYGNCTIVRMLVNGESPAISVELESLNIDEAFCGKPGPPFATLLGRPRLSFMPF
jgi:hypothetical protein